MTVDVILRQSFERRAARHFHHLLAVGDIAVERRLLFGQLVVQLFQPGACGVVLVHSGQPELQQLPRDKVPRRGVRLGEVQRAKRLVHTAIQRQRCSRRACLACHRGGRIPELRIRMHLLHQPRKIACGTDLLQCRVKWPQRVFHRARSGNGQQPVDVFLRRRQAFGLDLFESGRIRLRRPNARLRLRHLLRQGAAGQKNGNQGKTLDGHKTPESNSSSSRGGDRIRWAGDPALQSRKNLGESD